MGLKFAKEHALSFLSFSLFSLSISLNLSFLYLYLSLFSIFISLFSLSITLSISLFSIYISLYLSLKCSLTGSQPRESCLVLWHDLRCPHPQFPTQFTSLHYMLTLQPAKIILVHSKCEKIWCKYRFHWYCNHTILHQLS